MAERHDLLAKVGWSSISHSMGPAVDVPDLLHAAWLANSRTRYNADTFRVEFTPTSRDKRFGIAGVLLLCVAGHHLPQPIEGPKRRPSTTAPATVRRITTPRRSPQFLPA